VEGLPRKKTCAIIKRGIINNTKIYKGEEEGLLKDRYEIDEAYITLPWLQPTNVNI
jgi:hypothetical protein